MKYTDDQLIDAVKNSYSYLEVTRNLGLVKPGNYYSLKANIQRLNIDISHFRSPKERAKIASQKRTKMSNNDIFTKDSKTYYGLVKRRIISDNLMKYICALCNINTWNGKALTLQMDHINGNKTDHRLENLRFLCPNCHSQTDTYCGRNVKTRQQKYCKCGSKIDYNSKLCNPCNGKLKIGKNCKINWPPLDQLLSMLASSNYTKVSKELGVSDNAIRKHIRTHQ
jgi:5-methylcytosine-specific restriction endonuclease McrA